MEKLEGAVVSLHSALKGNENFRELCDSLLSAKQLQELGISGPELVFGAAQDSGSALADAARSLLSDLRELRDELSLSVDVPLVASEP